MVVSSWKQSAEMGMEGETQENNSENTKDTGLDFAVYS